MIIKIRITVLFFILAGFAGNYVFADSNDVETLKKKIEYLGDDSLADALLELANLVIKNDVHTAKKYSAQAAELSKQIDYAEGYTKANILLGQTYYYLGKQDSGNTYYQLAVQYNRDNSNKKLLALAYYGHAYILYEYGNYYDAFRHFTKAFILYEKLGDKENLGIISHYLGKMYFALHMNDYAEEYFNSALEYFRKLNNRTWESQTLLMQARLFRERWSQNNENLLDTAVTTAKLAIAVLDDDTETTPLIMDIYRYLATLYIDKKDYQEAFNYLDKAVNLAEPSNNLRHLGDLFTLKAYLWGLVGNYDKEIDYNKKALDIRQQLSIDFLVASSLANIGTGYFHKKQYKIAEDHYRKSLDISLKNNFSFYIQSNYEKLSELKVALGDYEKAHEYYKLHIRYLDSLNREETRQLAKGYNLRYDLQKKESQLAELQLDNQQIFIYLLVAIVLLAIMIAVFFIVRYKRNSSETKKLQQQKVKLIETLNKLAESENQYKSIVDKAKLAILEDNTEGKITFHNSRLEEIFGYSAADMQTMYVSDLIHPSNMEKYKIIHNSRVQGLDVPNIYEILGITKSGGQVHLEVDVTPLHIDGAFRGTRVYIWDITDRKISEVELQKLNFKLEELIGERTLELRKEIESRKHIERNILRQKELLAKIIDHLPVGVFAKNVNNDLRYTLWNANMEKIFDIKSYDIIDKTDFEIFDQSFADFYRESDLLTVRRDEPQTIPADKLVTKGGERTGYTIKIPIHNEDGIVDTILGILEDTTDSKMAEENLRLSQEKYKNLMDSIDDFIAVIDREFNIRMVNKKARSFIGKPIEYIVGRNVADIFPGLAKTRFSLAAIRAFKSKQQNRTVDTFTINGLTEWYETIFYPVDSEMLCIAKNISDRIAQEQKLRDLNKELENANFKLSDSLNTEKELSEMKSRFISMMSHEYRTPLTVISTSAQIIKMMQTMEILEKAEKHFKKIDLSVNALTNLIDDVLKFDSFKESIKDVYPRPVDLVKLCRTYFDEATVLDDKNHDMNFETEFDETVINSEPSLIRQIVMNLLLNSLAYSEPETKIVLAVRRVKNFCIISVRDSGHGMSESDLKHIFEPFYRGKKYVAVKKGLGLGMSLVKKYTDALNARIEIESTLGIGTSIDIIFPS